MGMISIRWDRILLTLAIIMSLVGVGVIALASAKEPWTLSPLALRQLVSLAISILIILIVSRIDYRKICQYSWWIYGGALLLLIITLALGKVVSGSQRWIEFGPVRIQPSEFAKLSLAFVLADVTMRLRHQVGWLWTSIIGLGLILPPMILIMMQPDLGTAMVFVAIWFGMLFIGGIPIRVLLGYIGLFIMMIWAIVPFLKPYQRARLTSFIHPDLDPLGSGYQVMQSKIAIGHGGLFGQGLFQGSQNNLGFLPGEHTDFIFAIAAEELGVVGAGLILLGLFMIIATGLAIINVTDDFLGKLLSGGLIAMIAFQIVVNVSITLGLMPVTGIPLPFISYGGSALLTNSIAIGVLMSIYKHAATKGRMLLIRGL
jgi:rod shape determining protein RodA